MVSTVIDSAVARSAAASCFNRVWDLMDKKDRSAIEQREMIGLAHVSLWLWEQVSTHTQTNLSIGYWQISRVYALVGEGGQALSFAEACMEKSTDLSVDPFYRAYAHEAKARALLVLGRTDEAREALAAARSEQRVSKEKEIEGLSKDIEELERRCR
jgi:hypothetical protein